MDAAEGALTIATEVTKQFRQFERVPPVSLETMRLLVASAVFKAAFQVLLEIETPRPRVDPSG